ncbi:hypothetical protein GCM10008956_31770 [Deinococcus arenae]|uniref:Uncharacterized protein n=1 Tax=Deinococcus arenae TaxID=1452751 RepID=A0A8H9GRE7_9DEIO|nr:MULTISPECIES: hypothetical protein [Deinococcus]GGM53407.1 hypothetical protein GCM10008956_31770 [Deinococcus arenae]
MTGSDVQRAATAVPQPVAAHTVTLTLASGLTVHVAHRQDVDGEAIVIEAPQGSGGFHPSWAVMCAARLVDGVEPLAGQDRWAPTYRNRWASWVLPAAQLAQDMRAALTPEHVDAQVA